MVDNETLITNKKNPESLKDLEIIFVSKEKISELAYELIETLFDITCCYLTDLSELNHFIWSESFPGHKAVKFEELSDEDKKLYPWAFEELSVEDRKKLFVNYPPLTQEEKKLHIENERRMLCYLIEQKYGISMSDYPQDEKLFVWKVAKYVLLKRKELLILDKV